MSERDPRGRPSVAETGKELAKAEAALAEPGAGALGTLECRVADLQERMVSTPARDLADVAARLETIRALVAGLGQAGYLLALVDATLADVRALAGGAPPGDGNKTHR